jgi:hypothetical protein
MAAGQGGSFRAIRDHAADEAGSRAPAVPTSDVETPRLLLGACITPYSLCSNSLLRMAVINSHSPVYFSHGAFLSS